MTLLLQPDQIHFSNGKPLVPYDECYDCFDGKGMLFRLVDSEKNLWSFYNDTADTVMKVRAVFAPGSSVRALQRTHLELIPSRDGSTVVDRCEQVATLEVEPGFTEMFIEGTVTSFTVEFQTEAAPAKDVQFEYLRPTVPYDKIYKCFKNNGNGLLFRLVDEHNHIWYFYNDTKDYVMKVVVDFAVNTEVEAMGHTLAAPDAPSTSPNGSVLCLSIEPGKTEAFIRGTPGVYKLNFAAEPVLAPPKPSEDVQYLHGSPSPAIIPNQSKVFRCFPEHSNGLLFRVVDEPNAIWAFYNDTVEYNMVVTVHFPPGVTTQFAPGVTADVDVAVPGGTVAVVEVPPLTTVPFLVGLPAQYELAFAANPVVKPPAPEEHIQYLHGEPDLNVIVPRETYKCFKEHGNGLLFRLVDGNRWAFYNDTLDTLATVRVSFSPGADIQVLGHTRLETDPETNGVVYALEVPPLRTELFVEGDVSVFTTKFTAAPIAPVAAMTPM